MRNCLLIILFLSVNEVLAQVADSSFFSSVKSLNPGISHLRDEGFLSASYAISNIEKKHDVDVPQIQGGIKTKLDLNKLTLFRAGKGGGLLTIEALFDNEQAQKVEKIKSQSRGDRKIKTTADSTYMGVIFDFGFLGLLIGKANYNYDYKFRVGEVPNISARDQLWQRDYQVVKIGTALKIRNISVGGFLFNQSYNGELDYTYYDPSTGNKGTTENYKFDSEVKGIGFGVGYKSKFLHLESSLEQTTSEDLNTDDGFPLSLETPSAASRLSLVAELKLSIASLGVTFRQVNGNFTDLEDIIKANLLYEEMGESDTRTETTFNFSFASSKGISYSGFYSVSQTETEEESDIFQTGYKYPAKTATTSYGLTISYVY